MPSSPSRPLRVFLGTQEISGLYKNLELGLVAIGVDARLIQTHPHPFDYGQLVPNPLPARLAAAAVIRHRAAGGLARTLWAAVFVAWSVVLVAWCIPRFDAFIFGWGISILPKNLDIPLLRLFRKRVIVVMGHGSEARPPYMSTPSDGTTFPIDDAAADDLIERTRAVASDVRRVERWASEVIGMRMTGQFFTRPFLDFYKMGVATSIGDEKPRAAADSGGRVCVLHAPSNERVKGTPLIREIMAEVVAEHPEVRYVELTNASHEEVMRAIDECAFVVDQMWCDIPMGAIGAEAASRGRATVISGYGWELWREACGPEELPPTFLTTPDRMKETILRCVARPDEVAGVAQAADRFVRSRWDVRTVALNYLAVLRGEAPADWIVTPDDVRYAWGNGVSMDDTREMVAGIVRRRGTSALQWPGAARAYGLASPVADEDDVSAGGSRR